MLATEFVLKEHITHAGSIAYMLLLTQCMQLTYFINTGTDFSENHIWTSTEATNYCLTTVLLT